jgi:di/tricarboxylate transporter
MSDQWVSILVLVVVFVVATVRPVNLGALALIAAFGVGVLVVGEDLDTVLSGFPADVFVLLVGVTYLFAIAGANGTIERIVDGAARLLRGNRLALPAAMFVLAALPTTIGAAGPAGIALLAPISARMAAKHRLNPRLAALMVINGSNAGNFSPLNVLGVIVNGTVERNGLDVSPLALWAANFAFNALLAVGAFFVFGGAALVREVRTPVPSGAPDAHTTAGTDTARDREPRAGAAPGRAGADRAEVGAGTAAGSASLDATPNATDSPPPAAGAPFVATIAAILAVAVGALAFGLDIGVLALSAALVLQLVFPAMTKGVLGNAGWTTTLLICGVVTYVALLQRIGTVDMIGESVSAISVALVAALVLCLIAGLTSAFASSIGILGALIPLAVPLLAAGNVSVTGLVIALAISATAVDATPFSSIGALTVASAPPDERDRLYRGLIRWGFSMVLIAPLATWLLFVVPA